MSSRAVEVCVRIPEIFSKTENSCKMYEKFGHDTGSCQILGYCCVLRPQQVFICNITQLFPRRLYCVSYMCEPCRLLVHAVA